MFSKYFEGWEIKPGYTKEFVSLWPGWLGQENLHKLDEVTEDEWARFNEWVRSLAKDFTLELVDYKSQSTTGITDIENVLSDYKASMNKESSMFTTLVLPELGCVVSEAWDYTYIIWHVNNGAVEILSSYIEKSGLKHFHD